MNYSSPRTSPIVRGGVQKNQHTSHSRDYKSGLLMSPPSSFLLSPLQCEFSKSHGSVCEEAVVGEESGCRAGTDADKNHNEGPINPLTDQEPNFFIIEPVNKIHKANRRSSALSECMMKERSSYKLNGRDKDGILNYTIYLEESQGFRWNRNIQRVNSRLFSHDEMFTTGTSFLDDFTDDDEESDDEDIALYES